MQNDHKNTNHSMDMYRTAFERLQFQDDYIFKFSALFVAFNGALGYAWKEIFVDNTNQQYIFFLYLVAAFGLFVCFIWQQWIRHNDYWHSVWVGCLINIEGELLGDNKPLYLFKAEHEKIAKVGGRCKPCFNGHKIASLLPLATGICWFVALIYISAFRNI